MNIFILSSAAAFLTSLCIILFVTLKGPDSRQKTAFIPIVLLAGTWCLFPTVASLVASKEETLFWVRVVYISALFTGPAFLAFGLSMAEVQKKILGKDIVRVSYVGAVVFLPLLFSNLMVVDVVKFRPYFALQPGSAYPLFILFFALTCSYSFHQLLRAFQMTREPKKRNQIKYVFIAYLLAFMSAFVHFGSAYGLREVFPHDFLVVACMMLVAHAIVRHQLMDIEVVIRRTAVFAGLFAFVYGTFTVVTVLGREFFRHSLGWNEWTSLIPTVLIITFSLRPLEIFLTNATERFLFQKKYSYRDLLKTFTNEVLTVLDIKQLPRQTISGLIRILKLESACLLLHQKDAKIYKVAAETGMKDKNIVFKESDTFIAYMKASNRPIVKDKTAQRIGGNGILQENFKRLNAQICMPVSLHDDLTGVLCLGMKKSGEEYNQEDIDILSTLARTEAIAIANAKLFDELSKTQAEAAQREKMAVIGTLAAGINHEICNPLGIVRGECEMFLLNIRDGLYRDKAKDEIMRISVDVMNKVIKETDRATAITKKLSGFAKPSKKTDFEEVFIEKEVDEVLGLLGEGMRVDNISVQKDFPGDFPAIFADKKQIQEVLFNIIRNAAQAIEKKGGRIVVSGYSEDGVAVVRITDNGTGIPADKLEDIFHPFYTTKEPGKGTGLGLFIVKQVIERNGGEILVQSEEGVGTTFTLRFPVAGKNEERAEVPSESAKAA